MLTAKFESAARYCCLAMLVGLSFTTAGANLALAGFIVCAIFSKKWVTDFHVIWRNPVGQASLLCFAMLCVSQVWADVDAELSWAWISKYKKLLLIPLAMPFFQDRKCKVLLFKTLFFSLLAGLVVSYTNYLGWTGIGDCPSMGCSAHTYITLGVLNCLLFVTAIVLLRTEDMLSKKMFLGVVVVLSWANVLFILPSRTAQILIFILTMWIPFAFWGTDAVDARKKWLGLGFALVLLAAASVAIYSNKNSRLSDSIQRIGEHKLEAINSTDNTISVDVRFEFYRKAWILISEKPLLGWGAGAHEPKLKSMSAQGKTDNERFVFSNPHNEYLTWFIQTGLVGSLLFLYWLYVVIRSSMHIKSDDERLILQGWLLIFTIGCFLNSFLLDFSEGYMTALLIAALSPSFLKKESSVSEPQHDIGRK